MRLSTYEKFGVVALRPPSYTRKMSARHQSLTEKEKETLRLLAEVSFGSGALAVIGGVAMSLRWDVPGGPAIVLVMAVLETGILVFLWWWRILGRRRAD